MKKRIISMILAIVLMLPVFGALTVSAANDAAAAEYVNTAFDSEEEKLAAMDKYAENASMELYVSKISGEIGIKNKITGEIMLSNPYDVTITGNVDITRQQYLSTVILTYKSISSGIEVAYHSFKNSAIYGNQMQIAPIEGGAMVTFQFGQKELILPYAILNEDLEAIFADMTAKDEEIAKTNIALIKQYMRYSEENNIWTLVSTSDKNKETLASFFEWAGYTLEEMHKAYERVGFDKDTRLLNYGTYVNTNLGGSADPYFKLSISYTLTDDGFKASVDTSTIEYDASSYSLVSIAILPYFNSALHKSETGYTFLPDGSGTLVRYEDLLAAGSTDNVATGLYGPDYAYYTISVKNQEQAIFPVFGNVITGRPVSSGFIGIIETGDTLATIVSQNDSFFHSAYSSFQISSSDKYDLADSFSSGASDSNVITVNGVSRYNGKLDVKYAMLTPSSLSNTASPTAKYDTSYIGMAAYYRDYLQANGTLSKLEASDLDEYTRIFLEVFGSLQVEERRLTFPVTVSKELTTFKDIIKMHKALSNIGVNNMSFILTGFANGGLEEEYPTYLKWQKVLGGEKDFAELMEYAQANGVEIAPNVNFSYSQQLKNFSGFGYKKTAAKALDGRYTTKREYDASIQMFQRKGGVVISTDSYDLAYTKFIKSAAKYNITSLATRALGSDISSDFDKETGYIFREQSKVNTQALLSKLSGKKASAPTSPTYNLILDAGNAYALPYASGLTNAPIDSSRLLNTSETVPFIGMVLHGSIEFAGEAINMEGDDKYMFLKALENGASLYFTVAMQNTELLKGTENHNQYYSVQFSIWRDEIAKMYKRYNDVMASKQDSYITEHEFMNADDGFKVIRVEDGAKLNNSRVIRVEYANGEGFILNYNPYDVIVECEELGSEAVTISGLGYEPYGMN